MDAGFLWLAENSEINNTKINMPKLSIIVPVYNAEKSLPICLNSLLIQTMTDINFWLVNDGSTDNSLEVCQQYANIDSRFHVINQKNAGAGKARDNGIYQCDGDFIGFVDADDWIEADMFEKMYDAAIRNDCDVVRCNVVMHRNGKVKERWNPPFCNQVLDKTRIEQEFIPLLIAPEREKDFDHRLLRGCDCYIFLKDTVVNNHIHFTNFRSGEDVIFSIEMLLNSKRMFVLPNTFYHYMIYNTDTLSKSIKAINDPQRQKTRGFMTKLLKDTSGYPIVVERWKQEDRRVVYLDIRIAAVYAQGLSSIKRLKLIRNVLASDESRRAFKDKIDRSLPLQMYMLYLLIKWKCALLLLLAVKYKLRKA